MRILIIEDEPATARRLEKMLKTLLPEVVMEETMDTVKDSVRYFNSGNKPDLVFMDIHLADGNSFEIFEKAEIKSPVIFTTAYDQYAIKAFKVNSIDYLLKPVNKGELEISLKKFQNTIAANKPNIPDINLLMEMIQKQTKPVIKRLLVKIGQKINAINIEDVAYFQVDNKAVYAVIEKGKRYPVDLSMEQLEAEIDSNRFFRINRSFMISFEAIRSMTAYSKSRIKIELEPAVGENVLTSTDRTSSFKEWLKGKN